MFQKNYDTPLGKVVNSHGINVQKLKAYCGFDTATLYLWAKGDREPTLENLLIAADALDEVSAGAGQEFLCLSLGPEFGPKNNNAQQMSAGKAFLDAADWAGEKPTHFLKIIPKTGHNGCHKWCKQSPQLFKVRQILAAFATEGVECRFMTQVSGRKCKRTEAEEIA